VKATRLGNQARLKELLKTFGIEQNYDALIAATKSGFGDSLYGQWPNWSGYSFYHL
jgi:hypothetical protein